MLVYGAGPSRDIYQLALSGTPQWSPLFTNDPRPDASHAPLVTYDSRRHRMMLVQSVGYSSGVYSDSVEAWTLALDGSPVWTRLATSGVAPVTTESGTAVYDSLRDRVIVMSSRWNINYHGIETCGSALSLADLTWSTPEGWRPPYAGAALTLDVQLDRLMIFGGYWSSGTLEPHEIFSDATWALPLASAASSHPVMPPASTVLEGLALTCTPNPASGAQVFRFAASAHDAPRALEVVDVAGRTVWRRTITPGERTATWSGTDAHGVAVPAGIYFARLVTDQTSETRRIVRVR